MESFEKNRSHRSVFVSKGTCLGPNVHLQCDSTLWYGVIKKCKFQLLFISSFSDSGLQEEFANVGYDIVQINSHGDMDCIIFEVGTIDKVWNNCDKKLAAHFGKKICCLYVRTRNKK